MLFLDGVFPVDIDGKGRVFYSTPMPTQEEVEALVEKVSKPARRAPESTELTRHTTGS